MACVFLAGALVSSLVQPARAQEAANAIAERRSGVDVYMYSRPARPYEVLEAKQGIVWLECTEVSNTPIQRAAKKGADGVIIYMDSARYEIIKYK